MAARVEVYPQRRKTLVRRRQQYGFRVIGANGEPMAASEGYTTRTDAQRGFRDLERVIGANRLPIFHTGPAVTQ